jgi:hypothetical protein
MVATWHENVHQQKIPGLAAQLYERFVAARRLPHLRNVGFGLEALFVPRPYHGMIVCD